MPYPKYKDSGVDWLGDVPEHWEVKQFRHVAETNPSKSETAALHRDALVSFLPMEAIGEDGSLDLSQTRPIADVENGYTYFRDGDVTLAKITPCFENGKGAVMHGLTNGIGFGTTELIVVRPRCGEIMDAYIHMIFASDQFRHLGESHMYGAGGQKRVPEGFVRNFVTAFPPVSEQCAIARFLADETAKIDALIAEQQQLIDLLKEKRQAVISHAVTKGLNPGAPMKPSGIEWLGDVPAHWSILPIKRDVKSLTSGSRGWAEHYAEDGELFIRIGNLTRDGIGLDLSDTQRVAVPTSAEGARTRTHAGDLLFSITAYLGSVAVVPKDLEPAYVSQHVALLRLRGQYVLPKWVAFCAKSAVGETYFNMQAYGGTKIQLSLDDVAEMPILVPSFDEQRAIIDFVVCESAKLDSLIFEAAHAVGILRERRAALISAAVTGKIDVRNHASAESA